MRHLVAFGCLLSLSVLCSSTAHAEGGRSVDLVVRESPPASTLDPSATEAPDPIAVEQPPAKPIPLHLRLDAAGRLELLLRVAPDQFLGKLAFAL